MSPSEGPEQGERPDEAAAPEDRVLSAEELDDLLDDQADAAEDFLNGLLDVLDLDGEAEADIGDDEVIMVEVTGDELGLLIGRHGATLEALQELTRAAVQHATTHRALLVLDIEGYRQRQRALLERKASAAAARVRKERKAVSLEPMTAFERKVIHTVLADAEGVMTSSEGEEPERYVVIRPS